jgi:hypothetical protein
VKGNSRIVINKRAIKPEAITPIMHPIMMAPRRFDNDSYIETLIICLFGRPTAL